VSALLEAKNVSVSYGKIEAVREVSLKLDAGQIVTVIGPNGAGKSSLLKALIGALPYSGDILFGGSNSNHKTLEDRVDAGLFLVPEERALFAELTVEQVSDVDLAYTPPLGSPWDAVQVATQTWERHGHP